MIKLTDTCLTKELENGRNLNIILLSHNAFWSGVRKLETRFANCHVTVFGGSTTCIGLSTPEKQSNIEDCDLIIFYSSSYYNEEEIQKLESMAFDASMKNNKRVSIGYQYLINKEDSPYMAMIEKIQIISFKEGREIIEDTYPIPYSNIKDLIELTLKTSDNYDEEQLNLKKKID